MNDEPEMGLVGDPERRANDTVHGFIYQFWHTVHAWLDLSADEMLFVEGAEDFDVVAKESATATQVKATSANITLRSSDVVEAIKNFGIPTEKPWPPSSVSLSFNVEKRPRTRCTIRSWRSRT